jgi:hypothetical protein
MAPDYDLSKLPASDADLWIYLQADTICGQIMADQAARLGFPPSLGDCIASVGSAEVAAFWLPLQLFSGM